MNTQPRLWIHEGNGHYIGSLVIVCADSREQAEALIRKELDDSGLRKERLDVHEAELESGKVIVSKDGDY